MEVCSGMGGGPVAVLALANPWVREVAFHSREISIIPIMVVLLAGGIAVLNHKYAGTLWDGMGGGPVAVLALASLWVREVAFRSKEISIIPTMAVLLAGGIAVLITNMQVRPGMGGGRWACSSVCTCRSL